MGSQQRDLDALHRFIFEKSNIRGELVQLDNCWQAALSRCEYPVPLKKLLGETMAAAALLAATIKFDGRLTIQAQGDGVISLLLVQCNSDGDIRGLINWSGEVDSGQSLADMFGKGHLAITIEPEDDGERYQGIVDLDGDSISDSIEEYFRKSEQIDTRVWLGCNEDSAGGLMLQHLPGTAVSKEVEDEDAWDRVTILSNTITTEEILSLDVKDILNRLYSEEDVRLFPAQEYRFKCTCSREKLEGVLRSIGGEDVYRLLEEKGNISIKCEYCGMDYEFDKIDVDVIFTVADCVKGPETMQ
ncbi:MAG: Hsp33 family molecular chaperone HslO [Gammaproteobacteria bacterium]|nr:MAG: Hsp33 family molecular chaperone HslO [Gammaproteobacteria bacterium]